MKRLHASSELAELATEMNAETRLELHAEQMINDLDKVARMLKSIRRRVH